jgi:hypothetical protein
VDGDLVVLDLDLSRMGADVNPQYTRRMIDNRVWIVVGLAIIPLGSGVGRQVDFGLEHAMDSRQNRLFVRLSIGAD